MYTISLAEKLARFDEHWSPRIIGSVNETDIKLVKIQGEFIWHRHEREDELFLVLRGRLRIRFRDHEATAGPGELVIVPRGVEHQPVADEETHVLLVEPATTVNTGEARDQWTVERPKRI